MKVNLIIILLTPVTRHETVVLQWVALHETSLYRLLNLVVELLYAADADLLAVLIAPDRKGRSPEA